MACCGSSATILDCRYRIPVSLPPDEVLKYLTNRANWLAIIPGLAGGTIHDGVAGAWTLQSPGGLTYLISNTVIASNVGAMGLSYDVRVRGTVSGLPIDFGFHAEYTFAPLDTVGAASIGACRT